MTITEYRSKKALVKAAVKVLAQPDLRQMLATVAQSKPVFPVTLGSTGYDHSRMLGMVEGYELALANLASLAVHAIDKAPVIQETYGAPPLPIKPPKLTP